MTGCHHSQKRGRGAAGRLDRRWSRTVRLPRARWEETIPGRISLSTNKPLIIAVITAMVFLFAAIAAYASKTTSQSQQTQAAKPANDDAELQPLVVTLEANNEEISEYTPHIIPESTTADPTSATLQKASSIAKSYLGTPYRWGGTTPSAFDCSGFTRYVYSKLGVKLPRTARAQYKVGKPVKSGSWKTGDLVFFNMNKGYVSHVGMYLGARLFIHASNPRTGVRMDNLSTGTYKKCYVGARRHFVS